MIRISGGGLPVGQDVDSTYVFLIEVVNLGNGYGISFLSVESWLGL